MRTPARVLTVALSLVLVACSGGADDGEVDDATSAPTTATAGGDITAGRVAFENNCARCHGIEAQGTSQGPSFINDIYVPSHHGDVAFQLAPRRGVQPHHWNFGAMPVIEDVTDEQIEDIIAYVRHLQREAGLID